MVDVSELRGTEFIKIFICLFLYFLFLCVCVCFSWFVCCCHSGAGHSGGHSAVRGGVHHLLESERVQLPVATICGLVLLGDEHELPTPHLPSRRYNRRICPPSDSILPVDSAHPLHTGSVLNKALHYTLNKQCTLLGEGRLI